MDIRNGVEWLRIYYVRGASPKNMRPATTIQDPPSSGWSYAFVIRENGRAKIICPYSLHVYDVPTNCAEIEKASQPLVFHDTAIEPVMRRRWEDCLRHGWQRDYDTITDLWERLGWLVPQRKEEDMKRERPAAAALVKPVKRGSKRGKLLQWFLEQQRACDLAEITEHFGIARSNALSYLYNLHKDHGIGYEVNEDLATLWLPSGCVSPFHDGHVVEGEHGAGKVVTGIATKNVFAGDPLSDDDWLDNPARVGDGPDDDFLEEGPPSDELRSLTPEEESGLDFDETDEEGNFLEEGPTEADFDNDNFLGVDDTGPEDDVSFLEKEASEDDGSWLD